MWPLFNTIAIAFCWIGLKRAVENDEPPMAVLMVFCITLNLGMALTWLMS